MRKFTILWADDDPDDLMMMREILLKSNHDYQIVEVHNGKEAIGYLEDAREKQQLPCLVILDINMPVMDGKETLSVIKSREELKKIPVVVFTTSESELDKMFCRKLGTEMVTKPPDFSSLETTVNRLLSFCNR
jgi:CheY-like chemotaxis protein